MPVWDAEDEALATDKRFRWLQDIQQPEVIAALSREHAAQCAGVSSDYSMRDGTRETGEHKMHPATELAHLCFQGSGRAGSRRPARPRRTLLDDVVGDSLMVGTPFSFAFFLDAARTVVDRPTPRLQPAPRVHLPLEPTPAQSLGAGVDECGMRVGAERVALGDGKLVLFDDCATSTRRGTARRADRLVLLFDVWHPDLSLSERLAIVDMFDSLKK